MGTRISRFSFVRRGNATMWVAIEVNLALWGMILCAAVQAGERFAIY